MLIVERWLLGRLRHRTFYSLAEVNAAIGELMTHLNEQRPIRRLGVTRRQLLEQIDRPALKSLPTESYEFSEWRTCRVGIDYHIEVAAHYYSVPHRFARAEVDARLPDSKTGAKVVHLGQPAIELLDKIERVEKNPWVIMGTKPGARLTDLQPFWQRVRARAGLKDVRIHDLRHTFASTAVAAGQGLPMIGKLLGHTQVQTTARYAHLAADPVKAAAEQVASNIAGFLNQAA